MRPGQLTPENTSRRSCRRRRRCGFNEAGAINPGKLVDFIAGTLMEDELQ